MKSFKILSIAILAAMTLGTVNSFASEPSTPKERKQLQQDLRNSRRTLYQRSGKSVRKDARRLQKEGWKSMDLPLEKLLERRNEKLWIDDLEGYPKFIHASVNATGASFSAAQTAARTQAVIDIATQIQSTVAAMVDQSMANDENSSQFAESINQTLSDARVIVAQRLGRIANLGTIYRMKNKTTYEVRSTYIYDMRQASEIVQRIMHEELEKKSIEHSEAFDKLFSFDKFSSTYEKQQFDEDL